MMTGKFNRTWIASMLMGALMASPMAMAESHGGNTDDIATSDKTFQEAVKAVKEKNYTHAYSLFELQAQAAQHDAQFNLALLLKSGRGTPQHYPDALMWSWLSYLGGIEKSKMLADEVIEYLTPDMVNAVRQKIAVRLRQRIDNGDKDAVMQFARYHLEIAEEPDYQQAYFWYSIAAAIGIDGSLQARDEAAENLDAELVIGTQEEARSTFYGLSFGK
jgi:hypothetical protein